MNYLKSLNTLICLDFVFICLFSQTSGTTPNSVLRLAPGDAMKPCTAGDENKASHVDQR